MNKDDKSVVMKDIFLILEISKIINFQDSEISAKACKMILQKKPFKSKYEPLFLERFEQLSINSQKKYICLTCEEEATENHIFCKKCYEKFILFHDNKKNNGSMSIEENNIQKMHMDSEIHTYKKYAKIIWGLVTILILIFSIGISIMMYNRKAYPTDISFLMGGVLEDNYKLFGSYKKKKYFLNGKAVSVIETEDGIRIGTNEDGKIFYIEILENSNSNFNILDISVGEQVDKVSDKLLLTGNYTENTYAEKYWASIFLQRGYPDIYILSFSKELGDGEYENVIAKIYQDYVISISIEDSSYADK